MALPPPRSTLFPYTTLFRSAEFFRQLNRLGAPPGAQFVKNAAGMGLDGVFADEKLGGDFAVAQALRDEFQDLDRKSTRLNSSHMSISYAVFCLKKKKKN